MKKQYFQEHPIELIGTCSYGNTFTEIFSPGFFACIPKIEDPENPGLNEPEEMEVRCHGNCRTSKIK